MITKPKTRGNEHEFGRAEAAVAAYERTFLHNRLDS